MNYLEFKRFFHQIKSDKAILFIEADWISESEFVVYADYGTALEFASSYQINTSFSSILNQHSTNDFVVVYGCVSTIQTFVSTCSTNDLESSYIITTNINGELEAHLVKDIMSNLAPYSSLNANGDKGFASDSSANYNHIIGYYVAELIAYTIVDMLVQYSHTINNFVDLDYGEASSLLVEYIHTTNIESILGSETSLDIENLVYGFIQNYSTIVDVVNSNDLTIYNQVISNLIINVEHNNTNDFTQTLYGASSTIAVLFEILRDALLSDYSSDYLSDLASSTLESLFIYEI